MQLAPSRRAALLFGVLLAGLALSGCRNGPDEDTLKQMVQTRLDTEFEEGLFVVESLRRRGSQPVTDEGEDRLLVYFDAELRFARDHQLANWDSLGVGSLVTALGATPNGVEGVHAGGNTKGDPIAVHGSMAFAAAADGWTPVTLSETSGKKPGRKGSDELPGYREQMDRIAEVAARLQREGQTRDLTVLESELEQVLGRATRRVAQRDHVLTLATGTPPGNYHVLGGALAEALDDAGTKAMAFRSSGSQENCRLVSDGEVQFALAQNDVVHMAYEGVGPFERQAPRRSLRAVAALYPEAVQIVTLEPSGIRTLEGLRGKRIAIGVEGSGMRINALQVIEASGMTLADFARVESLMPADAADALVSGTVDAAFLTDALPSPTIRGIASRAPIALVGFDRAAIDAILKRHPFFIAQRVAPRTYAGQPSAIDTLAVTATLLTRADVPDATVTALLDGLYASVKQLQKQSVQAFYISPATARTGISIPMHPAAEEALSHAAGQ